MWNITSPSVFVNERTTTVNMLTIDFLAFHFYFSVDRQLVRHFSQLKFFQKIFKKIPSDREKNALQNGYFGIVVKTFSCV